MSCRYGYKNPSAEGSAEGGFLLSKLKCCSDYCFDTMLFSTTLPRWNTACHMQNLPLGSATKLSCASKSIRISLPFFPTAINGVMSVTSTVAVSRT